MLFDIKGRRMNTTYMGINIEKDIHDHMRLVALYNETSMTRIIKKLLKGYLKKNPSFNDLFPKLADTALEDWNKQCLKNNKKKGWKSGSQLSKRFDSFLDKIENKLRRRRIPDYIINKLTQTIEQKEIERLDNIED